MRGVDDLSVRSQPYPGDDRTPVCRVSEVKPVSNELLGVHVQDEERLRAGDGRPLRRRLRLAACSRCFARGHHAQVTRTHPTRRCASPCTSPAPLLGSPTRRPAR